LTGTSLKSTRIVAAATSLLFAASALAQSAPERISVRVAQAEAPAANQATHSDTAEEKTLVLELAPTTDEATDALIMRLVAEAREEEATKVSDSEASAKIKSKAVQQALKLRGSRYRYGGSSRGGFDCSGFTQYVYKRMGVNLPHSSAAQFKCGEPVARKDLKPGDLVFFGRGSRYVGHVGIYIGDDKFVHASNPSRGVVVDSLSSKYYASRYRGARRVRE
jgi:cell wall-associated NlpC family hydrolase